MTWWQAVLVVTLGPIVARIAFAIFVSVLEGGMRSTVKVLNAGQAAYEASMNGVGTRWHRQGWHRPLRWWAWRCQQCFEVHQAKQRELRRSGH